jgi:hypothetical protein
LKQLIFNFLTVCRKLSENGREPAGLSRFFTGRLPVLKYFANPGEGFMERSVLRPGNGRFFYLFLQLILSRRGALKQLKFCFSNIF